MFPRMADILPPQQKGVAKIEHYTVSKLDVLRELMHGGPAEEGKVAILRIGGRTMMSDTRHEKITNYGVVRQARGNVLIAGLGIGMILHPILKKPEVSHITVLEKEQDVIDIVQPSLQSPKLTIVCADAFTWKPIAKFDCIYFDIWADGSSDLAKIERKRLGAHYRRAKAPNARVGYWRPMDRR